MSNIIKFQQQWTPGELECFAAYARCFPHDDADIIDMEKARQKLGTRKRYRWVTDPAQRLKNMDKAHVK